MKPRVLIAGIGNIFKGDDAFGVEVARRLTPRIDDASVRVVDFGIRGIDLAYTLLDETYDLVIFLDLVQRGEAPGTVYLIDPDLDYLGEEGGGGAVADTHGMHPAQVLSWVKAMGGTLCPIRLVGCEPQEVGTDDDLMMGLSDPVMGAVDQAIGVVEKLIDDSRV